MYTCLRRRLDDLRGASRHRPIMAGGFVKSGLIAFQNVAERPGLTHRHHIAETPAKRFILEAKIQGVCLLEYENDGWLDIYLVDGSIYEALAGKAAVPHVDLFHNNHHGTFTGFAGATGLLTTGGGTGARPPTSTLTARQTMHHGF